MFKCKLACLAALAALAFTATAAGSSRAAATACPVVPFPVTAGVIGPLVTRASGFQQYGSNPKAGTWICGATSRTASASVQAGCRLPYVDGLFYEYAHNIGRAKGEVWKKMKGLGDQAELIIKKKPDAVLGQTSTLIIKKGHTLFMVIGSVGNPKLASSLRPMRTASLIKLAHTALNFKCR